MDFTADECRKKAADQLAQADRNIGRQKTALQDSAKEWMLLASKLEPLPKE